MTDRPGCRRSCGSATARAHRDDHELDACVCVWGGGWRDQRHASGAHASGAVFRRAERRTLHGGGGAFSRRCAIGKGAWICRWTGSPVPASVVGGGARRPGVPGGLRQAHRRAVHRRARPHRAAAARRRHAGGHPQLLARRFGRHCGCAAWPGRAQRSSRASSSRRRWTCRPTWCCAAPTWSPRRTSLRAASCSPTTAAAGTGASGSHAASASRVRSASRTSATCASSSGARIAGSTPTRAACGRTSSTCAQGALRVRAVRLHVRPAAALLDLPHAVAGVAHRLRAVQDARLHAAHLPPVGVLDRAGAGPPPLADAPGELRRGYAR